MDTTIREAEISDWDNLKIFFDRVYRKNHPLQNKDFWNWQYGNSKHGRSFICIDINGVIVGHLGANFKENISWMINIFLDEEYRGKGIIRKLYALARNYYPLAATAANDAGLNLYRNMGWQRYYDLQRYVKIAPHLKEKFKIVVNPTSVNIDDLKFKEGHYFNQPGIVGVKLKNGSTGVSQQSLGGFRLVDINCEDISLLEREIWGLGYNWIDYITSWNDKKIKKLEKNNWKIDYKSVVPWRLDPVIEDYFCDITYLSEEPLKKGMIVNRTFSDHGRIGSL